jgi:hypothetical protein
VFYNRCWKCDPLVLANTATVVAEKRSTRSALQDPFPHRLNTLYKWVGNSFFSSSPPELTFWITFMENLTLGAHARSLRAKLCKVVYMTKKKPTSPSMIRNVYYSNFHSCLRYGIIRV